MELVFLFYQQETAEPPSQVNLFYPTPVVLISLNAVCPTFVFLNTSSGFLFLKEKKIFNNWKLTVVEKQFTTATFLKWNKYSSKKGMNLFFYNCSLNKLFV